MNKELIEAAVAALKAMASMFTSIEELAKTAAADQDAVVKPREAARVDRDVVQSPLAQRVADAAQRAIEAELENIRQEVQRPFLEQHK